MVFGRYLRVGYLDPQGKVSGLLFFSLAEPDVRVAVGFWFLHLGLGPSPGLGPTT